MSVNVTVAVPFDAVTAIRQGRDAAKMADAVATITKSAVEAVKALPYNIKDENAHQEADNLSIKSFDSDEPAHAPRPKKKLKSAGAKAAKAKTTARKSMKITIRDLRGGAELYEVEPTDTVDNVKVMVWDRIGIAPQEQRLLFAGKQLEDGRTLEDVCVPF